MFKKIMAILIFILSICSISNFAYANKGKPQNSTKEKETKIEVEYNETDGKNYKKDEKNILTVSFEISALIGILLIITGIFNFIYAFTNDDEKRRINAVLLLCLGIVLIAAPSTLKFLGILE